MTEQIVVIGAGGFGRETLDVISAINAAAKEPRWHIRGVVDDAPSAVNLQRLRVRQIDLLGGIDDFRAFVADTRYVVGIGSPAVRERISRVIDAWGGRAARLVHPTAVIGSTTVVSTGSVICSGAQLSTNVSLGKHTHVNPGAIIGHDSTLDDFVSINPGAVVSGEVHIGAKSLIGAGATILQGVRIDRGAIIGASACVTKDVGMGKTVVGVPAREKE